MVIICKDAMSHIDFALPCAAKLCCCACIKAHTVRHSPACHQIGMVAKSGNFRAKTCSQRSSTVSWVVGTALYQATRCALKAGQYTSQRSQLMWQCCPIQCCNTSPGSHCQGHVAAAHTCKDCGQGEVSVWLSGPPRVP